MYTDYFGFREKPFGVTPDPRFFFTNPCYQEAYASLLYGIQERRGFIVLTGEVGTGKTTVLRRLMEYMKSNVRFVYFYNTTLSFEELLDFMGEELGLPLQEGGSLSKIRALNQVLKDQAGMGGTVALLIDEAQNLGEEVLENFRLLSNLETTAEKLLQIVLVGQPELEAKLSRPELRQLKQRIAIQCRLEQLVPEEVGPFIDYRLNVVGNKRRQLFMPDAVQEIAYYSQGFPRLINILCDNALLIAYATSQKRVTGRIIEEVATDLRFALREEGPVASGEPRHLFRGSASRQARAAGPRGRGMYQTKAQRSRRGKTRIVAAMLCLGIGGLGLLYLAQPDIRLVAGVKDRLGTWQTTLQGWLGGGSEQPERRDPPGRGERPATVDQRLAASTAKVAPAPAADVAPVKAPAESRDSQGISEQTLTSGAESIAPTARGGSAQVRPVDREAERASWRDNPMSVPPGSTMVEIAANIYGAQRDLGLDLIKEYNRQIDNLNRIRAGQRLWLPPLSQETLVRQQPDGSYSLILSSFRSFQQAEQLAELARLKRYDAVVQARPVSNNLVLHRVEINGLTTLGAVDRAWEIARSNQWIAAADESSRRRF